MIEERKREQLLELVGKSEQERLPPGYVLKSKSRFTVGNLSYTVRICFVDLTTIVSGINFHSYSESDTLIKYSEARFSPVSSKSANSIQLATPSYYRNLNPKTNSEFIADNLESAYRERLSWQNQGSVGMETLKESLASSPFNFTDNVSIEVTNVLLSEFWMYCTSIAPYLRDDMEEQMKDLSPSYNSITKIENPSKFAEQLGRDVGKQIELHRDFEFNPSGWEFRDFYGEVLDMISFRLGEQSSGEQGKVDYLISVNHGPVIYLAEDEIEESIINVQKGSSGAIIPFLKRKKYEEQQEYRFVIRVRCHSPNENPFYLKVSDELRNLMKPIENVLW